jgi:hypothetical protein
MMKKKTSKKHMADTGANEIQAVNDGPDEIHVPTEEAASEQTAADVTMASDEPVTVVQVVHSDNVTHAIVPHATDVIQRSYHTVMYSHDPHNIAFMSCLVK